MYALNIKNGGWRRIEPDWALEPDEVVAITEPPTRGENDKWNETLQQFTARRRDEILEDKASAALANDSTVAAFVKVIAEITGAPETQIKARFKHFYKLGG